MTLPLTWSSLLSSTAATQLYLPIRQVIGSNPWRPRPPPLKPLRRAPGSECVVISARAPVSWSRANGLDEEIYGSADDDPFSYRHSLADHSDQTPIARNQAFKHPIRTSDPAPGRSAQKRR